MSVPSPLHYAMCGLATDTLPVASRISVLLRLIVRGPSGMMAPSPVLAVTAVTVELLKMANGRTVSSAPSVCTADGSPPP
jgi:hypothetical protein